MTNRSFKILLEGKKIFFVLLISFACLLSCKQSDNAVDADEDNTSVDASGDIKPLSAKEMNDVTAETSKDSFCYKKIFLKETKLNVNIPLLYDVEEGEDSHLNNVSAIFDNDSNKNDEENENTDTTFKLTGKLIDYTGFGYEQLLLKTSNLTSTQIIDKYKNNLQINADATFVNDSNIVAYINDFGRANIFIVVPHYNTKLLYSAEIPIEGLSPKEIFKLILQKKNDVISFLSPAVKSDSIYLNEAEKKAIKKIVYTLKKEVQAFLEKGEFLKFNLQKGSNHSSIVLFNADDIKQQYDCLKSVSYTSFESMDKCIHTSSENETSPANALSDFLLGYYLKQSDNNKNGINLIATTDADNTAEEESHYYSHYSLMPFSYNKKNFIIGVSDFNFLNVNNENILLNYLIAQVEK